MAQEKNKKKTNQNKNKCIQNIHCTKMDRDFFFTQIRKTFALLQQIAFAISLSSDVKREEKKHTKQSSCSFFLFFLLNTIHISHHHHSHSHRPHPLPPHQHMRQASPLQSCCTGTHWNQLRASHQWSSHYKTKTLHHFMLGEQKIFSATTQ